MCSGPQLRTRAVTEEGWLFWGRAEAKFLELQLGVSGSLLRGLDGGAGLLSHLLHTYFQTWPASGAKGRFGFCSQPSPRD